MVLITLSRNVLVLADSARTKRVNPQTTGSFFEDVINFSFYFLIIFLVKQYFCSKLSQYIIMLNTRPSALWILMTWCVSTRASVATMLIMHFQLFMGQGTVFIAFDILSAMLCSYMVNDEGVWALGIEAVGTPLSHEGYFNVKIPSVLPL